MPSITLRVENQKGIHARVAAKIVRLAEHTGIEATMTHHDMTVNLGSIMGLMMLSARHGTSVKVETPDPQSEQFLQDLAALFAAKFDEE